MAYSGAGMLFSNTKTDALGTNPLASAGLVNMLTAKAITKAQGKVHFNAGTVTLDDGLNVASAVTLGTPQRGATVTFAAPMADENYSVVIGTRAITTLGYVVRYASPTVNGFVLVCLDGTGNPVDISAAELYIDFAVHGRQDS